MDDAEAILLCPPDCLKLNNHRDSVRRSVIGWAGETDESEAEWGYACDTIGHAAGAFLRSGA